MTSGSTPRKGAAEVHPTGSAERFRGTQLHDSGFSQDEGEAEPAVVEAFAHYAAMFSSGQGETVGLSELVAALTGTRVLVALVAVLDSVDPAGSEKDSHMAAAMLRRPDGRLGLLAFTGVAAVSRWRADARPLPVPVATAAQAALEDGATALVVDVAGPVPVTFSGPALWALAEGRPLLAPNEDPRVLEHVGQALDAAFGEVLAVEVLPGEDTDLVVVLPPDLSEDRGAIARLSALLSQDPVLRSRLVKGLAIGVREPN